MLRTILTSLLLAAAARARAQAPADCVQRYRRLCETLAADPRAALRVSPRGVLLLNPGRRGPEFFRDPAVAARAAAGVDARNLAGAQRPLFAALREIAARHVAALPAGSPQRVRLEKLLPGLDLAVVDRPRCRDLTRPFVASFDGRNVTICPWMTHLAPESLLTVLSHELGHLVDPCAGQTSGAALWDGVPGFPPERARDCSTDDEDFADRVGAVISAEALRAGAATLDFPADPQQRAGTFLFYMLQPQCQVAGNARLSHFFAQAEVRRFLGCAGP